MHTILLQASILAAILGSASSTPLPLRQREVTNQIAENSRSRPVSKRQNIVRGAVSTVTVNPVTRSVTNTQVVLVTATTVATTVKQITFTQYGTAATGQAASSSSRSRLMFTPKYPATSTSPSSPQSQSTTPVPQFTANTPTSTSLTQPTWSTSQQYTWSPSSSWSAPASSYLPTTTSSSGLAIPTDVQTVFYPTRLTWYQPGLGACGMWNDQYDLIVAVSQTLFDSYPGANYYDPYNNGACNRQIMITYNGVSVVAFVEDSCPGCGIWDLDLSPAVFQALTPSLDTGVLTGATWQWTNYVGAGSRRRRS